MKIGGHLPYPPWFSLAFLMVLVVVVVVVGMVLPGVSHGAGCCGGGGGSVSSRATAGVFFDFPRVNGHWV